MTAHDMHDDITDAEASRFEDSLYATCNKCRATVWGTNDPSNRLGRLHASDNTTADRWCRR